VTITFCFPTQNAYGTVKGRMSCVSAAAVLGSQRGFAIREALTTVGWGAPRGVDADKRTAVLAALQADAGRVPVAPDPYFYGKQVRAFPQNYSCVRFKD
jgi:hypothetical protein